MNKTLVIAALSVLALAACADERRAEPVSPTSATAAPASPAAANKAAALKMTEELWGKKNPDAALEFYAPNLVNHAAIPSAQGAEGMRTIVRKLLAAFPDHTMKVDDAIAEGDRVVLRVTVEGTMTGRLDFAHPIEPTGKHVKFEQVVTLRYENGKIAEAWMTMDHLDLMKQLGVPRS